MAAGGDLQLGPRSTPAQVGTLGSLLNARLRFANLEGPLTPRGEESGLDAKGQPARPPLRFAAPPEMARWLRGHLDLVSLANNHALDQGEVGRADTVLALRRAGISSAFAGRDAVLRVGRRRITLIARDLPLPPGPAEAEALVAAIRRARAGGIVLISLHFGDAGSLLPRPWQRDLAGRLIDAGATAVLCHGPHTVRGVERRAKGVIAYSLGNLALACACSTERDAYVLRFGVDRDGGAVDVLALPIVAGISGRAPARSMDRGLSELIADLSRDLGSQAILLEDGSVLVR